SVAGGEQKKLDLSAKLAQAEARKMLEKAAESHTACPEPVEGSTPRFVRRLLAFTTQSLLVESCHDYFVN
ncbi:MAG TPA: hypothetical protein VI753_05815, partial [Anaerolineales bacterium]|nr:hypothetical protein [Anaerolineales bacterium]